MSSLLIYHTDLDGIGVGVLREYFQLQFDDEASCDYGFETDDAMLASIDKATNIVMADISVSEDFYNKLISQNKTIRIFDHHETSKWLLGKKGCVWDDKRSGTKIFFDEYIKPLCRRYKPVVEEFVNLIDIYDRWVLQSLLRAMSEDLQRIFVKMGEWDLEDSIKRHSRFKVRMLKKLKTASAFKWDAVELYYINEAKKAEEAAYLDAVNMLQIRRDNRGHKFAVFYAWGKISNTCHRLLNVDKMDIDYVVCAQTFHDTWGVLSLRAREGGFDLLQLAGVGGHKAAAGAQLTENEAHDFIDKSMCFKYKEQIGEQEDSLIEMCNDATLLKNK